MAEFLTENDLNGYIKSSELNTSNIFKVIGVTNQDGIYGGGLYIKSGYQACPANANTTVSFESSFPNYVRSIILTQHSAQNVIAGDCPIIISYNTSSFTFKILSSNTSTKAVSWLAIGY